MNGGKPAADRSHEGDEGKGPDAPDGGVGALPLQAEQEAETERNRDL